MLPRAWETRRDQVLQRPVALLHGADPLLADWAIAALPAEEFDVERVGPGPSQLREAVELVGTPSFFGTRRLVIATGVQALAAQGRLSQRDRDEELEALQRYAEAPSPASRLVIVAPSVDRRRRLFLDLDRAGAALACDPPEAKEAEPWLLYLADRLGIRLSPAARAAYLRSDLDLMGLSQALMASQLAIAEGAEVPGEVALWAAPPSLDMRVFALTDAMLMRQTGDALRAAENLLRQDESPIGLVALVARQFRLLTQAQALSQKGAHGDEVARALGVHPFVARKIVEALPRWPRADVEQAFEELLRCDIALKSGAPQATALELALLRIVQTS